MVFLCIRVKGKILYNHHKRNRHSKIDEQAKSLKMCFWKERICYKMVYYTLYI